MEITPIPYVQGVPIKKPGIYSGVPMTVYHSGGLCDGPSISSSALRTIFTRSPKHYWDESPYNEKRQQEKDEDDESRKEKEQFVLGRAAHHLFLGEGEFSRFFVIRPDTAPDGRAWNGNNLTCKEWIAQREARGLTILTPKQGKAIIGMMESLKEDPLVRHGVLDGLIEMTIVWKDEETGIWIKSRPDAIPQSSRDAADLKTTISVLEDDLENTTSKFAYHQQGALVREGFRKVLDLKLESFNLVFVEKARPHCARVVTIIDQDLDIGDAQNRIALRYFTKCWESGRWPGPGGLYDDAKPIRLKPWFIKQAEDRMKKLKEELER